MQVRLPKSDYPLIRTEFTLPDGTVLKVTASQGATEASVDLPEDATEESVEVIAYFLTNGKQVVGHVVLQEAKLPEAEPEIDEEELAWQEELDRELEERAKLEEIEKELDAKREGLDAGPVYTNEPAKE